MTVSYYHGVFPQGLHDILLTLCSLLKLTGPRLDDSVVTRGLQDCVRLTRCGSSWFTVPCFTDTVWFIRVYRTVFY